MGGDGAGPEATHPAVVLGSGLACLPQIVAGCGNFVAVLARRCANFDPLNHESHLALIGSFAHGDLLDHLDNAAPKLGVRDARERAG
jgi:hypothetical protein